MISFLILVIFLFGEAKAGNVTAKPEKYSGQEQPSPKAF